MSPTEYPAERRARRRIIAGRITAGAWAFTALAWITTALAALMGIWAGDPRWSATAGTVAALAAGSTLAAMAVFAWWTTEK